MFRHAVACPAASLAGGLILFVLALAPAAAQDCLDYGDLLHWHTSVPGTGRLGEGALLGDYLLMLDRTDGLLVFDLADRRAPARIASLPLPDQASAIAAAGNHAYVAADAAGLLVIDLTDPAAPVQVGQAVTPSDAVWVRVVGDHAFVSAGTTVQVIDVSDPAAPTIVGVYDEGATIRRLAAVPGWVYFSVSDWTAPQSGDNVFCGWVAYDLQIAGDRLLVAGWSGEGGRLATFSLADPSAPLLLSTLELAEDAFSSSAVGDRVCVSAAGRLLVFDIADPASSQLLGSVQVSGIATDVMVIGTVAYVTGQDVGLQIVDVADPTAPYVTGTLDTGSAAFGSVIHGGYLFVAAHSDGLAVAWPHCPAVVATPDRAPAPPVMLAAPWPNPCNPRASIAFELAAPGQATVAVHALDGRRVRLLADRRFVAGRHVLAGDGRDGRGRATASGVYLVRLVSGPVAQSRKLVLLR